MSTTLLAGPPTTASGQEVLGGPERAGSEQRWRLRLPDGRDAVLGQLLPELARDPALRRRYVRDVERLRELALPGVAAVLLIGPQPDPRDVQAAPPWRLREDPPGEDLEAWLSRRAPLPLEEATALGVALCDLLHGIHARGVVLRDLQPRNVLRTQEGALLLLDIGLQRVDVLSSRTAASLLLEGSPYAAPEQLRRTALDQRADLYSVGAILWRALTGTLPFGDAPMLLRERAPLPALAVLRPAPPPDAAEGLAALDALLRRCLSEQPEQRPESAAQVARVLRGEEQALVRAAGDTTCQACGARLRLGQRLCLHCGREAVLFRHAREGERDPEDLVLKKITEDAEQLGRLRAFLESVGAVAPPQLNFIIGHQHMYSKAERKQRLRLPLRLFSGLDPETAAQLEGRMEELGFQVKRVAPRRRRRLRRAAVAGGGLLALSGFLLGPQVGLVLFSVVAFVSLMSFLVARKQGQLRRPLDLPLRQAPAALPASDPLVARLAVLLQGQQELRSDVQEIVRELALLVQRVVDHRAGLRGSAAADLAYLVEPLTPLVAHVEAEVRTLHTLDAELPQLDEGTLVRALHRSEARQEPAAQRLPLLDALDRLRQLEDRRSAALHRLLEAASLLRRATELGLTVQDAEAQHERQVQLALAALGATSTSSPG